jgi:hypothetical protein
VTSTSQVVTVALVGAGNRGQTYARWIAAHPERARLVAVADPRPHQRSLVAEQARASRAAGGGGGGGRARGGGGGARGARARAPPRRRAGGGHR